jgi:uncharacterized protein YbjT (DUF2867 family)
MKIVIIGGSGLIGKQLAPKLREKGHEVLPASPSSGVNTLTGEGLADVLDGASTVIDVSNSPSFEDRAVMEFFTNSTRNLLSYERAAGVTHHVALSVVGTERLGDSGYFRAKIAQENLIEGSGAPYSIVHATQFFEFTERIADDATQGDEVHLAPVAFQPMAADDVASAVSTVAGGSPLNAIVEVGGPEMFRLNEFVAHYLDATHDQREVVPDPDAGYAGAHLHELSLVPYVNARRGPTTFDAWLAQRAPAASGRAGGSGR